MNKKMTVLVAVAGPLLAGCASAASPARDVNARMTPGMVMPDGSTMGAVAAGMGAGPSTAARMICERETGQSIATVLKLSSPPTAAAHWTPPVYTCSYDLPQGRLLLSVHESRTHVAAVRYAGDLRHGEPGASSLAGLTDIAFGTPDGTVVLVKAAGTLRVDATGLPAQFGREHEKRSDFAYELASDILGCWTGD